MSDLSNAIKQICDEKNLDYNIVVETIESALSAAYRKDFGKKNQNIKVEFDPETGKSKVYDVKTIVEDMPDELTEGEKEENTEEKPVKAKVKKEKKTKAKEEKKGKKKETEMETEENNEEEIRKFNPKTEIQLSDAKLIKKTAKVGDEIKEKLEVPASYGRMAAQTAKQVIIQRLREAEREIIFNDFKDKEHEVVSGVVQRKEGKIVLVDLGKSVGILPSEEQIYGEQYRPGSRIKVYVKEVSSRAKGPEIILSRTSDEILKKIFYLEIPEISNGLIELKGVAREAGFRSKVAVWADSDNVDPIGSCVGQRGARIQTIIAELGGEKVDIIAYDEDPVKFIANALSPAKIINITTNDQEKKATVVVSSDQLSLAIGKGGQNVRLAAKLTGWKIDIIETKSEAKAGLAAAVETEATEKSAEEKEKKTEAEAKEEVSAEVEATEKSAKEEPEEKTEITETTETAGEAEEKDKNNKE